MLCSWLLTRSPSLFDARQPVATDCANLQCLCLHLQGMAGRFRTASICEHLLIFLPFGIRNRNHKYALKFRARGLVRHSFTSRATRPWSFSGTPRIRVIPSEHLTSTTSLTVRASQKVAKVPGFEALLSGMGHSSRRVYSCGTLPVLLQSLVRNDGGGAEHMELSVIPIYKTSFRYTSSGSLHTATHSTN